MRAELFVNLLCDSFPLKMTIDLFRPKFVILQTSCYSWSPIFDRLKIDLALRALRSRFGFFSGWLGIIDYALCLFWMENLGDLPMYRTHKSWLSCTFERSAVVFIWVLDLLQERSQSLVFLQQVVSERFLRSRRIHHCWCLVCIFQVER